MFVINVLSPPQQQHYPETSRQDCRQTTRRPDVQRQTYRQKDGRTDRKTDSQTDRHTDGQTSRQTERQRYTQTDGHTDGETDRQTYEYLVISFSERKDIGIEGDNDKALHRRHGVSNHQQLDCLSTSYFG